MKKTNDNKQEEMTLKGWLYFGLFLALCCLVIAIAYALTLNVGITIETSKLEMNYY